VKAGDIIFLVLPIALVLLLVNSQRKRTRQAAALQHQVTPGAAVCTTSGLFGTIVSLTDSEFVLEAAPGVHLRFDRRAIGLVVPSNPPDDPSGPAVPPAPDRPDGHDHPA
jgi:preprotein translocase subunit YajC